ncbi:hypothetical protein [Spirosoma humi]
MQSTQRWSGVTGEADKTGTGICGSGSMTTVNQSYFYREQAL